MTRSMPLLSVGCASLGLLIVAGRAEAVDVGPGSFEYRSDTQTASNTGTADPNAVLSNLIFTGDGGAPNAGFPFCNFYAVDQFRDGGGGNGSLTYTFDAAPGQVFSGDVSVSDRATIFNFNGNILAEFSTDGGATFTTIDEDFNGDSPETALIDVDGADSFMLRYSLGNIQNAGQRDQVQLFRQCNADGLEPTPFIVSGTTAAVPEPAALGLLGLGGLGLLRRRRGA